MPACPARPFVPSMPGFQGDRPTVCASHLTLMNHMLAPPNSCRHALIGWAMAGSEVQINPTTAPQATVTILKQFLHMLAGNAIICPSTSSSAAQQQHPGEPQSQNPFSGAPPPPQPYPQVIAYDGFSADPVCGFLRHANAACPTAVHMCTASAAQVLHAAVAADTHAACIWVA